MDILGTEIKTISNSYFGIFLGFHIGGGKLGIWLLKSNYKKYL